MEKNYKPILVSTVVLTPEYVDIYEDEEADGGKILSLMHNEARNFCHKYFSNARFKIRAGNKREFKKPLLIGGTIEIWIKPLIISESTISLRIEIDAIYDNQKQTSDGDIYDTITFIAMDEKQKCPLVWHPDHNVEELLADEGPISTDKLLM
jgi:acyl-CoA hydrolase